MSAAEGFGSFEQLRSRLDEIVDEVNAEGISLDEALALYEEAVKLGLSACDLSEKDALAILERPAAEEAAPADAQSAGGASVSPELDAAHVDGN